MSSHTVVAEIVRSGFVEGHHRGSAVRIAPDGTVAWAVGDVTSQIYPRSCNKPIQAAAMVRAGLPLRGKLLALAAASHSGERFHIDGVRQILDGVGLDERALQTPPDYPRDEAARLGYVRSGHERSSIAMECSGKHSAMLATCVTNGWATDTYLAPDHPLQVAIAELFAELTGEPIESTGVDGCGAPLLSTSLTGLARAFARLVRGAPGSPGAAVSEAIVESPEYTSGTRRDELRLLRAFPGAIGKSGAEACYAVALPDGTAFACKIEDGGDRARPIVLAEAMRIAGYESPVLDELATHTLLGGGEPVGEVRPTLR
ncbi:asparaginase [Solicola gregarius]|uniref:Asparaginase n=1 Tax=Solicola gregarius TaxID=2908642 RepID=A0AA46TKD3_9ACTN|nr:asparaginase [Solicola gregarius]UYM06880.1 asparaginase [Solicola gregarius]